MATILIPSPGPRSHVFVDYGGALDKSVVAAMMPGLQAQLREEFAQEWSVGFGDVVRAQGIYGDGPPPMVGEVEIRCWDEAPKDQQDALGVHGKKPDGTPIVNYFHALAQRCGVSASSVISHELLEQRADPTCLVTIVLPDGRVAAVEVCDQVEAFTYRKLGAEVSNFNTRLNYGDETGRSKLFDFLGKQSSAFQVMDGGYAQVRDPLLGWQQLSTGMRDYRAELARVNIGRSCVRLAAA